MRHKSRALRYRELAEETRTHADCISDEAARQDMLAAAAVWDNLAVLAERLDQLKDAQPVISRPSA
jgi:hypothetical protein